jgi:hypothetical protein
MRFLNPAMLFRGLVLSLVVLVAGAGPLPAQQSEAPSAASPEHGVLKQFVGRWQMTSKGSMGEGQPEMEATATMTATMLGDLWVVCSLEGDVAGTTYQARQTIGYDAERGKYVGTWVDSMTPHLWVYEGTVDETSRILTLEAEGPNMMAAGQTTRFRDVYEFRGDDQILATSSMLGEDGNWITFMTGTASRVK